MAKITAIETQKNNHQRVNIYLDGEFAFGLARFTAAWLRPGQELNKEKIAGLKIEDAREVALQRALNYLSYRPRSQEEIRQNLHKHEIPDAVIEETIERLQKDGLADDRQFARLWVENRNSLRPRSRRALTIELRRKGLEETLIESVLDDNVEDEVLAYQAGLKKARKLGELEWNDFRRKLGDFLARRGFPYSIIATTVKRLWEENQAETDLNNIHNEETL
ncbi:MAG: RecX family transcriptional regulator [Anaerolineales bacterium]|nr:RecX family transcriptional regulator [Anaerolineales bacterium]